MFDELTLALRGLTVGLALALLLARNGLPSRGKRALWPILACLTAYVLRSSPQAREWADAALLPLSIGALLFPLAFWWLVHCAFDDRGDLPWLAWAGAAVMVGAGLLSRPASDASLTAVGPHLLQKACAAGFVLAGLWRLWRSDAGDLVAGRRRLRGWLIAYMGAHGLVILTVELVLRGARAPAWLDALNVAVIGLALAVALALMLGFRETAAAALFGPKPDAPTDATVPLKTPGPESAEAPWLERLQALMSHEHVYRDPELTVAGLASRLGLPEYRLRELIHRRLGYRNFQAFVNEHRLKEVEQRFADPAFDQRPILTLALEAGFGSIGPFNRTFRERHAMAPSEYRSRRGAVGVV